MTREQLEAAGKITRDLNLKNSHLEAVQHIGPAEIHSMNLNPKSGDTLILWDFLTEEGKFKILELIEDDLGAEVTRLSKEFKEL